MKNQMNQTKNTRKLHKYISLSNKNNSRGRLYQVKIKIKKKKINKHEHNFMISVTLTKRTNLRSHCLRHKLEHRQSISQNCS